MWWLYLLLYGIFFTLFNILQEYLLDLAVVTFNEFVAPYFHVAAFPSLISTSTNNEMPFMRILCSNLVSSLTITPAKIITCIAVSFASLILYAVL